MGVAGQGKWECAAARQPMLGSSFAASPSATAQCGRSPFAGSRPALCAQPSSAGRMLKRSGLGKPPCSPGSGHVQSSRPQEARSGELTKYLRAAVMLSSRRCELN